MGIRAARVLGCAAAGCLVLGGCSSPPPPDAADISAAMQADGVAPEVADCFAEQALDAGLDGDTLTSLAEDGVVTDEGGDITVAEADQGELSAISTACSGA